MKAEGTLRTRRHPFRGERKHERLGEHAAVGGLPAAKALVKKDKRCMWCIEEAEVAQERAIASLNILTFDPNRPEKRLGRCDLPGAVLAVISAWHGEVALGARRRECSPMEIVPYAFRSLA